MTGATATGVMAEMLSAYRDRELTPGENARLRAFLDSDAEARELLEAFDRVDDAARASFDAELDAPVPLVLARTVRSGFAARRRRAVTGLAMRWAGPVAAALAIVIVGHQWSLRHAEQALEAREAQIVALADQAVQDALEHALSGAAVSVSDPKMASTVSITPTRTYRSETKHWCREFVEDLVIDGERVTRFGLACRETDGGWRRVQTQQPGSMPPPVSSRTL
jgi:surface antigen